MGAESVTSQSAGSLAWVTRPRSPRVSPLKDTAKQTCQVAPVKRWDVIAAEKHSQRDVSATRSLRPRRPCQSTRGKNSCLLESGSPCLQYQGKGWYSFSSFPANACRQRSKLEPHRTHHLNYCLQTGELRKREKSLWRPAPFPETVTAMKCLLYAKHNPQLAGANRHPELIWESERALKKNLWLLLIFRNNFSLFLTSVPLKLDSFHYKNYEKG